MVPSEGVRAGVLVADEIEGGGVGLFRRPPVRERKAVKSAWVEERRSGVWGTWSAGGDMRRSRRRRWGLPGGECEGSTTTAERAQEDVYERNAGASSLSWVLGGGEAGRLAEPIWGWRRKATGHAWREGSVVADSTLLDSSTASRIQEQSSPGRAGVMGLIPAHRDRP